MLHRPPSAFAPERHDRLALLHYLAAWAEANPAKIAAAVAPGYRFHDPLVGTFTRQSLPQYFELLRGRFATMGVLRRSDVAFSLRGPMETREHVTDLQYWREASAIGLTGTASISITEAGVIAEVVAYDLNLASDVLRRYGAAAEVVRDFEFAAAA